jgi:hypothetical protein
MLPAVYNTAFLCVHLQSFSVPAVGAQSAFSVHPPTIYTVPQTVKVAHFAIQTLLYHPRNSTHFSRLSLDLYLFRLNSVRPRKPSTPLSIHYTELQSFSCCRSVLCTDVNPLEGCINLKHICLGRSLVFKPQHHLKVDP